MPRIDPSHQQKSKATLTPFNKANIKPPLHLDNKTGVETIQTPTNLNQKNQVVSTKQKT